jgi:hypothetical protein
LKRVSGDAEPYIWQRLSALLEGGAAPGLAVSGTEPGQSPQALDGANRYIVHFPPGQLPPAHAFWSLTMYELPSSPLTANPINRYLVNSPMLPQFAKDRDGGLTLYVQNESPGANKEANWLPAPKGPFWMALRLYWPKEEALDGSWKAPPLKMVE